jgi:hypothetical protein
MAKAAEEKVVTEKDVITTEPAPPPVVVDFAEDMGAGFENADSDSYAIPFLRILQAMSPQVKKSDAGYIKGAEEGHIFNTVTEEIIDGTKGILVIPCSYEHIYLLWAPGRAGLRGRLSIAEYTCCRKRNVTNDKGQTVEVDANGNVISDARQHYVLVIKDDGALEPALISMSSTQIKKSKKWMSMMTNIKTKGQTLPMFSQIYRLTVVADPPNDKGTWMGWKIEHVSQIQDRSQYDMAKAFMALIKAGKVSASDDGAGAEDNF